MKRAVILLQMGIGAGILAGCGNPVVDAKIAALGPEINGVREGEFHRPGQPCTDCHSDYGPGPTFSLAGTIFAIPAVLDGKKLSEPRPVNKAVVTITDTTGTSKTAITNCVGNFFFTPEKYDPQFPLHIVVEAETKETGKVRKVMGTRVNREGSCAGCHFGNESVDSPGWVWAFQDLADATDDPFPKVDPHACQGAANFP